MVGKCAETDFKIVKSDEKQMDSKINLIDCSSQSVDKEKPLVDKNAFTNAINSF